MRNCENSCILRKIVKLYLQYHGFSSTLIFDYYCFDLVWLINKLLVLFQQLISELRFGKSISLSQGSERLHFEWEQCQHKMMNLQSLELKNVQCYEFCTMKNANRGFPILMKSLSTSYRKSKETRDDIKYRLGGARQEGLRYN